MSGEQKANDNPNNWMRDTLARFVPQMKKDGKYDGFVALCDQTLKDDKLGRVRAVLSKYIELEDGDLYLVIGEIVQQKNAQVGMYDLKIKKNNNKI